MGVIRRSYAELEGVNFMPTMIEVVHPFPEVETGYANLLRKKVHFIQRQC